MPSLQRTFSTALAVVLITATTASAQQVRVDPAPPAGTRLLDLEVVVTDLAGGGVTTYEAGEHVELTVGDRVRIELVGAALVGGVGRRVTLPADFTVGGGGWRFDLVSGSGTAVVHAQRPDEDDRGREGRLSHLAFEVRGDYEPRRFTSGSVTFEIEPGDAVEATSERWQRSERVSRDLAHVLLLERPEIEPEWVELVYRSGERGVRDLARALAAEAVESGRLRETPPWEVTAELYRHLLGREGSAAELWRADPGFRGNLELLEERGYARLVDAVVASEEFRERHDLEELEDLPRDRAVVTRPG